MHAHTVAFTNYHRLAHVLDMTDELVTTQCDGAWSAGFIYRNIVVLLFSHTLQFIILEFFSTLVLLFAPE
jgi:hypothetical protein